MQNNPNSQGVDCAQGYGVCASDGSQLTSNNDHAVPTLDDEEMETGKIFDLSEANLVIGHSGIGLENVLFIADADQGEASFDFDDVVFNGMSFWDYGGDADDLWSTRS